MVSTSLAAANVINALHPRYIAMTGICAGIKGKAALGDVLLVDPSWDWQSGKRASSKDSDSKFAIAPHQLPVTSIVRAHMEQLRADKDALQEIVKGWDEATPGRLSIVIGPVASGSAVLADSQAVTEVRKQHRELSGIEMKPMVSTRLLIFFVTTAYGFALKSVCDFADADKDDRFQDYAAYTSAQVLRLLFERYGKRLLKRD